MLTWLLTQHFRGTARLRSIFRQAGPFILIEKATRDGLPLKLDAEGYIDGFVIETGYYEREVLDTVLQFLPANGVFWDIGANIGLHSLTVKFLRSDVDVVAFEPAPNAALRFILNQAVSGLTVDLWSAALSNQSGFSKIEMIVGNNPGLSTLRPRDNRTYEGTMQCRTERAEDLIEQDTIPEPNVIKIDVEDFEFEVLEGFGSKLSSPNLKAIVFESHGERYRRIADLLGRHGFSLRPISAINPIEMTEGVPSNFLAWREP